MGKVKLSIIIPVYNSEEYLDRCIQSVTAQDYTLFEVILVDDGSTDSSPVICDMAAKADPRFRVIHKPNGGVSTARNAGLDAAVGEYVMFLDSDDALLPYALEDMLESTRHADVVVGGYAVFKDNVPIKDVRPSDSSLYKLGEYPGFYKYNLNRNCELLDAPWAKLFKREMLSDIRFDTGLSYAEDKLFVFTVLSKCSSILTLSNAVYAYHLRSGSLGSDISSDRHLNLLRRFLPLYVEPLSVIAARCPSEKKVQELYHNDVVGRYLCRILNIFTKRRTEVMTVEYIAWVYEMMSRDKYLKLFSLRLGQVPNILLYKIGNPKLSYRVYHMLSGLYSIFRGK